MSLNGLDVPAIQEAYQAAIAEAGGWFLVKYVSRDSVELLARGKSGVHEARNAIANYKEQSPLYGLIIYRRRKILIKYIPEGTSRLLQARTAVHFQDILERYSPYETLLELSHPDGLNDTSLASSFPLHTASPSASSNRLHEISEDGEDSGNTPRLKPTKTQSSTGSIFGTRQYKLERRVDQLMRSERSRPPSIHVSSESTPTVSTPLPGAAKPPISQQFLVREDSGTRSITSLHAPSTTSLTDYAGSSAGSDASTAKETETIPSRTELPKVEEPPSNESSTQHASEPSESFPATNTAERLSQQSGESLQRLSSLTSDRSVERPSVSERPSISERSKISASYDEPFDFSYLEPKPKVKLGPRPVAAPERTKRPLAAGISALPAAYKPAARKQEQEQRRKSQSQTPLSPPQSRPQSPVSTWYTPPPIPETPDYNPRPLSCKSLPSQKGTGMTSDKLRLMKAVELRKKKLRKSNPQVAPPLLDNDAPEMPKMPGSFETPEMEPTKVVEGVAVQGNVLESANKADSGIELNHGRDGYYRQDQMDAAPSVIEPKEELANSVLAEFPVPPRSPRTVTRFDPMVLEPATTARPEITSLEPEQVTPKPTTTPQPEAAQQEPEQADLEPSSTPQAEGAKSESDASEQTVLEESAEPGRDETALQRPRSISSGMSTMTETREAPQLETYKPKTENSNERAAEDTFASNPDAQGSAMSTSLEHLITDMPTTLKAALSAQPASSAELTVAETTFRNRDTEQPLSEGSTARNSLNEEAVHHDGGDLAKRRRGFVEPLHIDVEKVGFSDGEFGSDDDLMEELQSATLHEAKPMAMAKSPGPGAQFFPGRTSNQSAVSTPSSEIPLKQISIINGVSHTTSDTSREQSRQRSERAPSHSPEPAFQPRLVRTGSAPHATPSQERSESSLGQRRKVSNGITQRIQALAEKQSLESGPLPNRLSTPEAATNAMNIVERRPSAPMRSPRSRTSSYRGRRQAGERMSSTASTLTSPSESAPIWTVSQDGSGNRNSVSVKARIVRPTTSGSEQQAGEGAAPSPSTLQESKLEINHVRGTPTPTSVSQAFLPPLPRTDSNSSLANSPVAPRESVDIRSMHSSKRKSWGRKQPTQPVATPEEFPLPPMSSRPGSDVTSTASIDEQSQSSNRTSRFFKRMSNIGSMSKRRSAAQSVSSLTYPTTTESSRTGSTFAGAAATNERDHPDMPPAVVVGDLNVQFPDTLLWKRRSLSLTSTGHLCLSLPNSPESQRPGRQFALTDFKAPFAPDADRMELPFSVWLEFASGEGGVLQVACEDSMGQRQVLRLLSGYWKSWVGQ